MLNYFSESIFIDKNFFAAQKNSDRSSRAYTSIGNYNYGSWLLSTLYLLLPTLANMSLVQARTLPLQDSKTWLVSFMAMYGQKSTVIVSGYEWNVWDPGEGVTWNFCWGWYAGLDIFSRKVADNRAYKVCYYIHQIPFQANE